jgi:hypothetical protein
MSSHLNKDLLIQFSRCVNDDIYEAIRTGNIANMAGEEGEKCLHSFVDETCWKRVIWKPRRSRNNGIKTIFWKYIESMGSRVNVSSRRSCLTADFVMSGVEFYYSLWPVEELGEQAEWSTGCGDGARGGCVFAWNFSVTSLPVRRRREVLDQTRRCLCISPSWPIVWKFRWPKNIPLATKFHNGERRPYMRDFRLPPRCKWAQCSSAMLRSAEW